MEEIWEAEDRLFNCENIGSIYNAIFLTERDSRVLSTAAERIPSGNAEAEAPEVVAVREE